MELIEKAETNNGLIKVVNVDGPHYQRLRKGYIKELGLDSANNIMNNALGCLKYFPDASEKKKTVILCVGKVQSGKTSFFINAMAMGFDNGYPLAFLIGGTKNSLRDQNLDRSEEEFVNDSDIVIKDLNNTGVDEIRGFIDSGKKVIVVALKNASGKSNLNKLKEYAEQLHQIPTMIVDDEGDEVSPGADKLKKRNNKAGKTSDVLKSISAAFDTCAFLSVTATPEANILLSVCNDLSPDYCALVEAGSGYTGGATFHDEMDNPYVIEIDDTDNFYDSVPESFVNALFFFLFSCCLKAEENEPYSMLIHPSVLTAVQNNVAIKISNFISSIATILSDENNIAYDDQIKLFINSYDEYKRVNPNCNVDLGDVVKKLPSVINNTSISIYNTAKNGTDILQSDEDKLYKIYVGGNMLGRGITLKNLIVTYMYREAKQPAVDTLYQRARWFGYKKKYLDVCRVYMTKTLKKQFVAAADHEKDMWISLRAFLSTGYDFKKFPRIFTLNDETGKMMLTRRTVSKTVTISQTSVGYTPDESIDYKGNEKAENRNTYENFISKWKMFGVLESYANENKQNHLYIKMKFSDFYNDFLSKYNYPFGSKFSKMLFVRMMKEIEENEMDDEVGVMIMRYDWEEHPDRKSCLGGRAIIRLAQGSDSNTEYEGDRYLSKHNDEFYFQIHNITIDKGNEYIPVLALNNPTTKGKLLRYVTGDNDYGI